MTAPIVYAQPANENFVNGTRQRIKGALLAQWFAVLLNVVIFGFLMVTISTGVNQTREILTRGIETSAEIGAQRPPTGRNHTAYVTYRYSVNGVVYEHEESVSSELYATLGIGTLVTVRYLAANPQEVRLTGAFQSAPTDDVAWVFGIFIAAVAAIPLWQEFNSWRFSHQGQLLDGTLTGARGWGTRQGYRVRFEYTFLSPLGVTVTGKRQITRSDLRRQPLPEAGSPVKVLYISDNSHRML